MWMWIWIRGVIAETQENSGKSTGWGWGPCLGHGSLLWNERPELNKLIFHPAFKFRFYKLNLELLLIFFSSIISLDHKASLCFVFESNQKYSGGKYLWLIWVIIFYTQVSQLFYGFFFPPVIMPLRSLFSRFFLLAPTSGNFWYYRSLVHLDVLCAPMSFRHKKNKILLFLMSQFLPPLWMHALCSIRIRKWALMIWWSPTFQKI